MTKELEEIARAMGAKIVGEIPDVGGGAFGAARLARVYQQRSEQARGPQAPESAPGRLLEIRISERLAQGLESLGNVLREGERSHS